jgi:hypothetical protein
MEQENGQNEQAQKKLRIHKQKNLTFSILTDIMTIHEPETQDRHILKSKEEKQNFNFLAMRNSTDIPSYLSLQQHHQSNVPFGFPVYLSHTIVTRSTVPQASK